MSSTSFELVSILDKLQHGDACRIEGATLGPLSAKELAFLDVLIRAADRGGETSRVVEMLLTVLRAKGEEAKETDAAAPDAYPSPVPAQRGPWKLGLVRAKNFRGLCPAGKEFSHNFDGRTTLVFGRNGTGKSCLLGAIAWALTGHFPLDDVELDIEAPELVETFVCQKDEIERVRRDPLLALGAETDEEYWVQVQLVSEPGSLTVRRDNLGNFIVKDHRNRVRARSLEASGFTASDVGIPLLMPRWLRNVTFKKSDRLWETLSMLLGHERALKVGRLAGEVARLGRRNATTKKKELQKNLRKARDTLRGVVQDVSSYATQPEQIADWCPAEAALLEKKHVQAVLDFSKEKYRDLKSSLVLWPINMVMYFSD